MNGYFTRYFKAYFDVGREQRGTGFIAAPSRRDQRKFKDWLERFLYPKKIAVCVGEVKVRVTTQALSFPVVKEVVPERIQVPKEIRDIVLSLNRPKPKVRVRRKEHRDEQRIAERRLAALRKAREMREEEIFLLAIL